MAALTLGAIALFRKGSQPFVAPSAWQLTHNKESKILWRGKAAPQIH